MDYTLKTGQETESTKTLGSAAKALAPLLADERTNLVIAIVCVIASSCANLLGPIIVGQVIDTAMQRHDYPLLLKYAGFLSLVYLASLGTSYLQTLRMGTVGRNVLYKMRNALFTKLSNLPIAFFAQNRAGDLISRVNSDTDKINQFFAQALMQFFGSAFLITGAAIVLLTLNWRLGLAALAPAVVILILTRIISPWVKRTNRKGLEALGALSGDISESLANFKVIIAFGRTDYFKEKFDQANQRNFKASIRAGISSGVFMPLYTLAGSAGGIAVLVLGVTLISGHQLTVGTLVKYLLLVTTFYNPLRQLATVWSSLQMAMAALDRVSEVLGLETDLVTVANAAKGGGKGALLCLEDVGFSYPNGKRVLDDVSLTLERGKTYALVGPTGGGKTTTAMLMARLYDPSQGRVWLDGLDIRGYSPAERAQKIGFILQEPFLLSGTVKDNITYGHDELCALSEEDLTAKLADLGLIDFIGRFNDGLATPTGGGDTLSLGQKQLVAFLRAVLRQPEILILDEATANIDTVTEQLLEEVLARLPAATTKVIIAHRLNTIQNADDIFFVGGGALTEAGSMEDAVKMLLDTKLAS